eukprot:4557329-Pleurochrysis_carterae.AAC.1
MACKTGAHPHANVTRFKVRNAISSATRSIAPQLNLRACAHAYLRACAQIVAYAQTVACASACA